MKVCSKTDGSVRILNNALKAALGTSSSRKDLPSAQNLKSLEIVGSENVFQSKDDQSTPFDISCWIENSISEAIDETLQIVPESAIDEWAKNNRLLALSQLQSCECSAPSIHSPYSTVSNDEFSAPNDQFWPPLYESSNPMNDIFVSETKFASIRSDSPPMYQQERMKPEFHHGQDFSINVCKSTNQNSCHEESESDNCCEPTTDSKDTLVSLSTYGPESLTNVKSSIGFMDAHCHLDLLFTDENFHGTYAAYIAQHKKTFPDNYQGCVTVFCKPWTFSKIQMWRKHLEQPNVWGAFGCHPKQAKSYNADVEKYLERALNHPKVCALGEIGLDYSKQNWRYKKEQQRVFKRQLTIAKRRNLRVVIHCREADDDAIEIMREILPRDTVFHLHCFTSSWRKAEMWMRAFPNVHIGITNLVSFPSATDTHEVAGRLPLNRLLLETDAPFFVPKGAPKGTKFSHPGMAIYVAAEVAAIRNIPIDEVLKATCANTRFVYNIP